MNYLTIALAFWVLGIPGHYSEWDHFKGAKFLAAFWPLTIVFGLAVAILAWAWQRVIPRFGWRIKWIKEVSVKHYGWTTKDGKLCGLIKIVKVFEHTDTDNWIASGFGKGRWILGTVTRPELKRK